MTMLGLAAAPAAAVEGPTSGGSPLQVVDTAQHGNSQTLTFDNGAKFTSTPTSAFKSGSFNWYAKFQIGFNTRTYTANSSGTHTFHTGGLINLSGNSAAGCSSNAVIQVTLYAEDFPGDDSFGTKSVSCKNGGTVKWSGVRADTFYYYVKVTGNHDSGLYSRELKGSISYP